MTEDPNSARGFKDAIAYLIAEANNMKWYGVSFFLRKAYDRVEKETPTDENEITEVPAAEI